MFGNWPERNSWNKGEHPNEDDGADKEKNEQRRVRG